MFDIASIKKMFEEIPNVGLKISLLKREDLLIPIFNGKVKDLDTNNFPENWAIDSILRLKERGKNGKILPSKNSTIEILVYER